MSTATVPRNPVASRRGGRSFRLALLALAGIASALLIARSSSAQYMYLDSNGDGVNTAADVVTATGTTNIEIWLRTDKNRDGSSAVCSYPGSPFTINSYGIFVRATGGTVTWVSSENLQVTMGVRFGDTGDATGYYIGYGGGSLNPPGDYKLCRLSMTVASGTPSIGIVQAGPQLPSEITMFGSACVGLDFDNTLKLGSDWFDIDGLAFSGSGGSDTSPVLSGPSQLAVQSGETAMADFGATDGDGDPVTISLGSAPAFASLVPMGSGPGNASARVHAVPRRVDVGSFSADLVASDGVHTTSASLDIVVTPGPNHPPTLSPIAPVRVVAGAVASVRLTAADADGDAAAFTLASGPSFAQVSTLHAGWSASSGRLLLRPELCDIGSFTATIVATTSDGSASAACPIEVLPGAPPPAQPVQVYQKFTTAVASGDFNEDGKADVVRMAEVIHRDLEIMLGDGTGNLTTASSRPLQAGYVALETADWNHDGHADLAIGAYNGPPLQIYMGRGDGTLTDPVTYPDIVGVDEIRAADLDGDGIQDLVATSETPFVYVLHGVANGAPVLFQSIHVGSLTPSVSVGDYDLDGRLDLAISTLTDRSLHVLLGHPDGRFGGGPVLATGSTAYGLVTGDWDEDGILDLAGTASYIDGALYVMRGRPGGTFELSRPGGTYLYSFETAVTDWNGDGHLDIMPASTQSPPGIRLLLGTGHGEFNVITVAGSTAFGWNDVFADLNGDARPDIVWGDLLTTILNTTPAPLSASARSFTEKSKRSIPIASSSTSLCLRVEPVDGAFEISDVDPSSLKLVSEGTGSVSEISASAAKSAVAGDTDGNNVAEYPACFAMSDVAQLFSLLRGKQEVQVGVQGRLTDGRRICSIALLTVVGTGNGGLAARIDPNPLNPEGTLRFTTTAAGSVTIRVFDVAGRLARTIWNAQSTAPGAQEAKIDGRDSAGRELRSGVYFFRIEGAGVSETGRFTILK